ncbi:MAG: hypothetical protein REI78_14245 [Pedobacter sp.]|nr:hypothetical protein [Pedobacter sp.]
MQIFDVNSTDLREINPIAAARSTAESGKAPCHYFPILRGILDNIAVNVPARKTKKASKKSCWPFQYY